MSSTIQKTAKFRNLMGDLEAYLPQAEETFRKLAEDQSQGPKENDVAVASAPGEVAGMLPGGTTPGTETPPESNPLNDAGVVPSVEGAGITVPEEEETTTEQSPTAKVASNEFNKLAESLIAAAKGQADPTEGSTPLTGKSGKNIGLHGKINPEPVDKTKSAELEQELSEEEVSSLTRKIAHAQADAAVGRTLADMVLAGFSDHARKVAAAEGQAEVIREAVTRKVAAMRELGWNEDQIGHALEEMGRIDGINLKIAEGEMPPEMMGAGGAMPPGGMGGEGAMQEITEGEMPPGAEGGMPPGMEGGAPQGGPGGDLPPELQEIVASLVEMIQTGEVTPEEAIEAAEVIDQQLGISDGGGQGGPPQGPPGDGGMPPGAGGPPQEGPPQDGGEGPGPDGSAEHEGGESPAKEESEEKSEPKEEKSEKGEKDEPEDKQKEARFYNIGVGIRHKVAERRCRGLANQVFGGRMYPARKVASMLAEGSDLNEAIQWVYNEERRKVAEGDLGVPAGTPPAQDATLEDVFTLLDSLVANGAISEEQAAAALEALTVSGDTTKVAHLFNMVRGVIHGTKVADGEGMAVPPIDPGAMGGAGGPAAGPEGAPPAPTAGPADVAPTEANPQQAVEQLIGALEQLVSAGILTEEAAVGILNQAGLGGPPPEAGGAPAGGAPPPEAAPPMPGAPAAAPSPVG